MQSGLVLLVTCLSWMPLESSDVTTNAFANDTVTPTSGVLDTDDQPLSAEKRLVTMLLKRYSKVGKAGRPVRNSSHTLPVTFGLGLIQMELDERHKILSMSMWTRYEWRDEYLMWDPGEYEGVNTIRINPEIIWIPDIMLYNTAEADTETREALAVIHSDGYVHWFPHSIFRSSCSVDVTNFPFDRQQCHMWFGSWTHNSKDIDLNMAFPGGIDLSTFRSDHKESSGWDIYNITAVKRHMPSEEEDPNFTVITFEINLKRKMVFSTYILTLPCVFLACLTLVVFWLPPERPDRTALAMSSFSSFMVLLLILVEAAMPTASSVPTLGVYYCFNMVLIMLAIILSSIVVNVSRGQGGRPPPRWLTVITTRCLGRLLCMRIYSRSPSKPSAGGHLDCDCDAIHGFKHSEQCRMLVADTTELACISATDKVFVGITPGVTSMDYRPNDETLQEQLADIRRNLHRLEQRLELKSQREMTTRGVLMQWKDIAVVLDRAFFVFYVLLIAVSLAVLFPRPSAETQGF